MHPAEQTELLLQVPTFKGKHKAHETDQVERETDEAVVRCERRELGIGENNVLEHHNRQMCQWRSTRYITYLEVVDDGFTIKEIVCCGEEIPVEGFAPWVLAFLDRALHTQGKECSDFSINPCLADEHKDDHVNMAH